MLEFWSSFIPQLLATLVGAGVGVLGVFVAFSLQRRASSVDGLDRAVESLLLSLSEMVRAIHEYEREMNVTMWSRGDRPHIHYPHPGGVSIAVELLKLKCPARDSIVAERISETWDTVAQAKGAAQKDSCGVFAGAVAKWHGGKPQADVFRSLRNAQRIADPDMAVATNTE